MENTSFGLVTWDEVEIKQKGGKQLKKDEYMRLLPGDNLIRIITRPAQYSVHTWKSSPKDPGFGDKVYCSYGLYKKCPCCETEVEMLKRDGTKAMVPNRPKNRWFIGIIDRRTQSYKILDITENVFKEIQSYTRDEEYGSPERYDLNIKVDKNGGPSGYYKVIAKIPKPLSPADLEIKNSIDVESLVAKVTPPTPEKVQERMNAIKAKKNSMGGQAATTSVSEEDDDQPIVFKNADDE